MQYRHPTYAHTHAYAYATWPRFPYLLCLVLSASNAAWNMISLMLPHSLFTLLLMGTLCYTVQTDSAESGTGVIYYLPWSRCTLKVCVRALVLYGSQLHFSCLVICKG